MYPSAVIILIALERTHLCVEPEIPLHTVTLTVTADIEFTPDFGASSLVSRDADRDMQELVRKRLPLGHLNDGSLAS